VTERGALGSPVSPPVLVAGGCLMVVASLLAVVLDWPGVVAVLAIVPGLFAFRVGRDRQWRRRGFESAREAPKPTWGEIAVPFVPILALLFAGSYVFDTTRWSWLAPFLAVMVAVFAVAEELAWRRVSRAN
jgi:hypothetical protein